MSSTGRKKRAYNSRIRRITTCSECHRRRQKCDRQTPCNICITRGCPENCIYPQKRDHDQQSLESGDLTAHDRLLTFDDPEISALSAGLGYQNRSTALNEIRPLGRVPKLKLSLQQTQGYQQVIAQIPDPSATHKLVNVFFEDANWYFTVLQPNWFFRSLRDWQSWRTKSRQSPPMGDLLYFPALLLQVMAMAIQFLKPELKIDPDIYPLLQPTHDQAAQRFSDAGESLLNLIGRRQAELSSVEADIMRCAFLKNSGNGFDAWYALGSALRSAQEMGLHLEPNGSKFEYGTEDFLRESWDNEHKRCVWSTLFSWEAHMALQLGRPRMINITDCTVRKPQGCEAPKNPSTTLLRSPQDDEAPSIYHIQLVKHDSAIIIHKALSAGLLLSSTNLNSQIRAIHEDIEHLVAGLPPALRLTDPDTSWDLFYPHVLQQRIQVRIMIDSLVLALYRPHIAASTGSLDTAMNAAKRVLEHSQDLFDIAQPHHYRAYSLIFYTIDAGIFLAATVGRFDHFPLSTDSISSTLSTAIQRLRLLQTHHSAAIAGESVLTSCLKQIEHKLGPLAKPIPFQPVAETQYAQMPHGFDDYGDLFVRITNDSTFTSTWIDESLETFAAAGMGFGSSWISLPV